jgi:lipoprotein-releasing system permease protein
LISTLEKEVTFRFLKARKKDGFLNVISIFSFIGISLGVAVLIIVMSVMNGFRTELINKIVGFNPHVTVKPYNNPIKYKNYDKNLKTISENLVLSNSSEAIIIRDQNSKGIILRGYLEEDFSKLQLINNKNFLGQNKKIEKNSISIGRELSFNLDLNIGDNITLMSSSGVETIIGNLPKQKTFWLHQYLRVV